MRWVRLGDVATIRRTQVRVDDLAAWERYLGLEHIARGGAILSARTIGEENVASTKFRFDETCVLFGKLRPNLGKIALPDFSGVCSTDILPIVPCCGLDRRYLAHYLRSPHMLRLAASRASGANLPRLNSKSLGDFLIPLPDVSNQRHISAILDEADTRIAARRQQIDILSETVDAALRSLMEAVGECRCRRVLLEDVVIGIESGLSPACESRPAEDSEWGVLKLGAVTYGEFREYENKAYLGDLAGLRAKEVRPGDVLMARKNTPDLVGSVVLVRDVRPGLSLPDLMFRIRLDRTQVEPSFFQSLMMSSWTRPRVRALAGGSAKSMSNISQKRLKKLELTLPPLADQRTFAFWLDAVHAQRVTMERALALDEELFASLQLRAFRGVL